MGPLEGPYKREEVKQYLVARRSRKSTLMVPYLVTRRSRKRALTRISVPGIPLSRVVKGPAKEPHLHH